MDEKAGSNIVEVGVDLSEFYMSVEWDILEVPAVRWVSGNNWYNLKLLRVKTKFRYQTYLWILI